MNVSFCDIIDFPRSASFIGSENKWAWMVGNCPPFFLKTTKLTILHRLFECLPAYDIVVWPNMATSATLIAIILVTHWSPTQCPH